MPGGNVTGYNFGPPARGGRGGAGLLGPPSGSGGFHTGNRPIVFGAPPSNGPLFGGALASSGPLFGAPASNG